MKTPQQSIDIVIPTHKKDLQILEYCIEAAKKKIVGAGRIIVISKERYSENAEWFDEALFPFSIELVQSYVGSTCGWYFQQLLKFYAPLVIPNISENVLLPNAHYGFCCHELIQIIVQMLLVVIFSLA